MPFIDVDDVTADPDFMTLGLQCIRTTQTVGPDGIAVNVERTTTFAGCVTSLGGRSTHREPQGAHNQQTISIVTRFRLTDGSNGLSGDQVVWGGNRYSVTMVDQYLDYGQGFVQATCELLPLIPAA